MSKSNERMEHLGINIHTTTHETIMKSLNQYIKEKLIVNKDYRDNKIVVKSFDKLRKIIKDRYDELGPGTEQNPINFNDIDVSNIDSFFDNKGIFEETKFKYIDISDWDVSEVTDMKRMFYMCKELKSVGDISKWNVSNVKSMRSMFYECDKLESVGNLSYWDVSNVTDMCYIFAWCESFNQDLSNWNVSKVRYHGVGAFTGCSIKMKYQPKFK